MYATGSSVLEFFWRVVTRIRQNYRKRYRIAQFNAAKIVIGWHFYDCLAVAEFNYTVTAARRVSVRHSLRHCSQLHLRERIQPS